MTVLARVLKIVIVKFKPYSTCSYNFFFKYLELRFKSHALRLLATSIGMLDYVSGFYYHFCFLDFTFLYIKILFLKILIHYATTFKCSQFLK